ncbi:MAG: hypothetical protein K6C08_14355 [Oscillospiraceae bacterium]|nr:hypothetical protein [Oscillospiraceae bacterium]
MNKKEIAGKVVDHEKKKLKKKVRKAVRRVVFGSICLLCVGYFLGIHHRVIEAALKGTKLPAAPKGHFCH